MLLIIAAALPVLVFLVMIYRRDTGKEPLGILLKCLVGGVLSVLISLLISVPLTKLSHVVEGPALQAFYKAFFLASIPEEVGKFLILYLFVWKSKEFNQRFDGIVYAVFISLGFALVENIMYVTSGGLTVAFTRALLAVPGHGFFGVMMGYFFSKAKFIESHRSAHMVRALAYPIVFHGFYDFFLMWMSHPGQDNSILSYVLFAAFFAVIFLLWRAGLKAIRIHTFRDFVDGIKWK